MGPMSGDILDNRGRGTAGWSWPSIHPEGRKFGLIAGALSLGAALMAWLNPKLGKHERVQGVTIMDVLPKTMIGKLDRKALRMALGS